MIEEIHSGDSSIIMYDDGNNVKTIFVDKQSLADSGPIHNKIYAVKSEINNEINSELNEINNKLNLIKEEYENQLQRQKVHISRGDRIQGSRIHGRGHEITVSKGFFRNQTGIIGSPN